MVHFERLRMRERQCLALVLLAALGVRASAQRISRGIPPVVPTVSAAVSVGHGAQAEDIRSMEQGPLLPSAGGPQFVALSIHAVDMKQDTTGYGERWAGMHMTMHNQTPEMLVWDATGISNPSRIIGLPDWAKGATGSQKYDLQGATDAGIDHLPDAHYKSLVLSILTSRFGLKAHLEMREVPVWKLVVAKGGLKEVGPPEKRELKEYCWRAGRPGSMKSYDCTFADLAQELGEVDDVQVVDATGDSNRHSFELKFDYTANVFLVNGYRIQRPHATDAPYAGLFSALPEELGLRLVKGTARLPVVVIDHIERPSEN